MLQPFLHQRELGQNPKQRNKEQFLGLQNFPKMPRPPHEAQARQQDMICTVHMITPSVPMDKAIVKTDIQIAVPHGCYGRVAPRSGLAAKHFIDVGAGVVDEDYRGNVGVVLFNFGKETFEVKKGDRVAQLVCERICYPELEEQEVKSTMFTAVVFDLYETKTNVFSKLNL
ncbi:Deoxyuridine 5'-triphosphate nucleotidohydrolase [Oryzias melastigma]|uniref:Deoxyuridine 5'-triphosphate nucleotidohydrolase n=1 Tax=Oryzias melastigma TaxID=30732 RepID=A0A834CTY6_ORYME|nr:Deoxyuridine 5'-triphosphate nucleotidohydrolase [Oryzias melastigma]